MNNELSLIGAIQRPLLRAKRQGELLGYLQDVITQLAHARRRTIAEALEMPGASMGQVTSELGISRSAVVKLATPDLREQMAQGLIERINRGLQLPPKMTPGQARVARKGLAPPPVDANGKPVDPALNDKRDKANDQLGAFVDVSKLRGRFRP
jgi:hypothetical protein